MIYLDADHSRRAVLAELRSYADLVADGCYAVVADSNINGHPVTRPADDGDGGPYEAIEQFVKERDDFEIDTSREHQLITFNPHGYLRRRIPAA